MVIRVGLPKTTGEFPGALFELDHPGLVSANGLWDQRRKMFRMPGWACGDLDLALDSAGFVVMKKWKGSYPWTVQQYVELAGLHGWTWWASMDFCCEQEIAGDEEQVLQRVEDTARYLLHCNLQVLLWRSAGADWLQYPMPILQGWDAEHYKISADITAQVLEGDLPELVGVGSVCRRHLHGPDGLIAILEALDDVLPPHVKLHLFGVKGAVLKQLGGHSRVASMDSLAWDYRAREIAKERRRAREKELGMTRRLRPTDPEWIPCNNALRIEAMRTWVRRQSP